MHDIQKITDKDFVDKRPKWLKYLSTKYYHFYDKWEGVKPRWMFTLERKLNGFWRGRFKNRHWQIRTKLSKNHSWYDSDIRILYGMMAVLDEFYEKEISLNIVDWDGDEEHKNAKKEIDEIKAWWDNYPNRLKEIDDSLATWSKKIEELCGEGHQGFLTYLNSGVKDPEETRLNGIHSSLENKLAEEEQIMLHRLIDVRKYMWT